MHEWLCGSRLAGCAPDAEAVRLLLAEERWATPWARVALSFYTAVGCHWLLAFIRDSYLAVIAVIFRSKRQCRPRLPACVSLAHNIIVSLVPWPNGVGLYSL